MKVLICPLAFSCLISPVVMAQTLPAAKTTKSRSSAPATHRPVNDPADTAAKAGLEMLRTSITTDNFKQFGFTTLEETSRMQLGEGVPVFYVRADQLKDYVLVQMLDDL
jgi:hypothetical protein